MYNETIKTSDRDYAKELEERAREAKANPLSQYSTSQLKAELRRRKRE